MRSRIFKRGASGRGNSGSFAAKTHAEAGFGLDAAGGGPQDAAAPGQRRSPLARIPLSYYPAGHPIYRDPKTVAFPAPVRLYKNRVAEMEADAPPRPEGAEWYDPEMNSWVGFDADGKVKFLSSPDPA